MVIKLTSRNRVTLPKALSDLFPRTRYFEVTEEAGRIVLVPANDALVRRKLVKLKLRAKDVRDAIRWARKGK